MPDRIALLRVVIDEYRRRDDGQRADQLGMKRRQHRSEDAAHRLAAEVHVLRAKLGDEIGEIADQRVEGEIARQIEIAAGLAEPAHVGPHDAVVPREIWNPAVPEAPGAAVAVLEN